LEQKLAQNSIGDRHLSSISVGKLNAHMSCQALQNYS